MRLAYIYIYVCITFQLLNSLSLLHVTIIFFQHLASHLEERHVAFLPIKSPPVLSIHENHDSTGSVSNFHVFLTGSVSNPYAFGKAIMDHFVL